MTFSITNTISPALFAQLDFDFVRDMSGVVGVRSSTEHIWAGKCAPPQVKAITRSPALNILTLAEFLGFEASNGLRLVLLRIRPPKLNR